jgi:hypothetical protein
MCDITIHGAAIRSLDPTLFSPPTPEHPFHLRHIQHPKGVCMNANF